LATIPASSTTKTGHHDTAEILLKVALKHQKINQSFNKKYVLFKICGRFDFHFEAVLKKANCDGSLPINFNNISCELF
jgi:translation initiation factor 2 beta subunit (eIF-2beta)/eIF-5